MVVGRTAMFSDPGTFWHVAVGEKMLAMGHVVRADTFSFTRVGQPWVADQWLAECGMALVHRRMGWEGLLLVAATLLAGVYAWIGVRLLRRGLHPLAAGLLLAVILLAGAPQFLVRPLIATIVLLAVTFAWLVDVEAGRRRFGQLWWLVPLFILWTNLHGGILGGLGTVGLCLGGSCAAAVWRWRTKAGESSPIGQISGSVALLIALAGTTLWSPYGSGALREWIETLAMPLPGFIMEHARLDPTEPLGWATLAIGGVYLVTLIGVLPQRLRAAWLVPLVWFVLAVLRVRNIPLFGVTAAIALADMLPYSRVGRWLERYEFFTQTDPASASASSSRGWRGLVVPVLVVAAVAAIQTSGIQMPVVGRGWVRFDPSCCPAELLPAIDEINRSSLAGEPIFNDMDYGGFLIYHAPRLRVFVDDRCPLYGTAFLSAYDVARRDDPAQIDVWRERYGFRFALVKGRRAFDRYLSESPGWRLAARSPEAAIYRYD